MTTVYWCPLGSKNLNLLRSHYQIIEELSILFEEPKPLMKELLTKYKDSRALKCPALQAYCKNTFVITAPMDATVRLSQVGSAFSMAVDGYGWTQDLYDSVCTVREDGSISISPVYVFYAKESVEMEVLPVFLLDSPSLENTLFIAGSYDIGKWIRPIDFSFYAKDNSKPINIKRGDPLFFVRFKTKEDEKITLERVEQSQELLTMIAACIKVKYKVKNISLSDLYKLAKSYIDLFLKGKNT